MVHTIEGGEIVQGINLLNTLDNFQKGCNLLKAARQIAISGYDGQWDASDVSQLAAEADDDNTTIDGDQFE